LLSNPDIDTAISAVLEAYWKELVIEGVITKEK
jgi:hypothetical protein